MKSLALVAAVALAYVMPGGSILRRLADGRDTLALTTLKVDGTATVAPALAADVANALGVQSDGELSLTMQVQLKVPGRCRIELSSPETTKVVAAVSSNGRRRTEGLELKALQVAVDEVCALLAVRGAGEGEARAAVERHLGQLKVDYRRSSLGRFGGTVAYVLGDTAPNSSQLWVYKEHFLPARVRFADDQTQQWDVRFLDYASQPAGDAYPRVVEVYQGAELKVRLVSLETDTRARVDDARF